jgi:hypothetical protein
MCNAKDMKDNIRMGTMKERMPAITTVSEGS